MAEHTEREIKLAYDSPTKARQAVVAAGAIPLRPRRLQNDCLLDRDLKPLGDRMCTLRVRLDGDLTYFTFKGTPKLGTTKVREELETLVDDGKTLLKILERLGFRVWFSYQKYREEFRQGSLVVAVDESPIGTFIELEGNEKDILAMTTSLGRCQTDFLLDSYLSLFRQHCAETGSSAVNMLFDEL